MLIIRKYLRTIEIDDAVRFLDKDGYMYTCAWICETTKLVLDAI